MGVFRIILDFFCWGYCWLVSIGIVFFLFVVMKRILLPLFVVSLVVCFFNLNLIFKGGVCCVCVVSVCMCLLCLRILDFVSVLQLL